MSKEEWKRHFARERQRRYRARMQQQSLEANTYPSTGHATAPRESQMYYDHSTILADGRNLDTWASGSNLSNSYQSPSDLYNLASEPEHNLHPDPSSMTSEEWKRYLARERQRRYRARNQKSTHSGNQPHASDSGSSKHRSTHQRSSSLPVNQDSDYNTPAASSNLDCLCNPPPPHDLYSSSSLASDISSIPSQRNQSLRETISSQIPTEDLNYQRDRRSYHQGFQTNPSQRDAPYIQTFTQAGNTMENNDTLTRQENQARQPSYSRYHAPHEASRIKNDHYPHSHNLSSQMANPHLNYHSSRISQLTQPSSDRPNHLSSQREMYPSVLSHPSQLQNLSNSAQSIHSSSRISIGNLVHPYDLSDNSDSPTSPSCSRSTYH